MTHNTIVSYIRDNHDHLNGVSRLVLAVSSRLIPFKKIDDLIPNSQLVKDSLLSHRGVNYAMQKALDGGYLRRDYVCGHCHISLGQNYGDVQLLRCPVCGHRLFKNVWQRLGLSTRGKNLLIQLGVQSIIDNDKDTLHLPQDIITFSQRAANLLNCPNQWSLLAKRIAKDKPSKVERELALAYCFKTHVEHNCSIIYNLPSLFRAALETIRSHQRDDLDRQVYLSILDKQRVLETFKTVLMGIEEAEKQGNEGFRMSFVAYAYEIYRDAICMWDVLDDVTLKTGREPRTFQRKRKHSVECRYAM